jgi:spore coat protein U-like protein
MQAGGPVMRKPMHAAGCALTLARALVLAFALPTVASAECTLNIIDINFGSYDTLNPLATDIAGDFSVTCDTETSLQVSLSAGLGTYSARRLLSGTDALLYNLYTDPTRLTIWGDGSPGTGVLSLSGTGGNYTVYGRIPARQNVPVGTYGDTITVILTF